jgi:DNA-binding LacI/PurR family transcriptional regulator
LSGLAHVVRQRYLGWKHELDKAGAAVHIAAVPLGGREQHYEAARQLLCLGERPTAVLCFSDVMATATVRAAHDLQLQVPQDLSVVGFDDSPVAEQLSPALTTVKQDFAEKGRLAAKLMTDALANKADLAPAKHYLLPTELILRESTAASGVTH